MKIKLFTIPNCITLCNLLCGVASIVCSLVYSDLQMAFAFIIASAVFDFCDGLSARLLNQYSAVGVQLDSLADMVSFGVAPALGMSVLCGAMPSAFGLSDMWCEVLCYVPLVVAALSALRLAKFNIDETQHEEFEGLATPPAAMLLLSIAALCERYSLVIELEWLVLISVLVAALLVSPIRMFSFKFHEWGLGSTNNKIRFGFLIVSCLLICLLRLYAIPAIIVLYIVVSVVRWIFKKR
uniref:CDP-alcohol phosphatidyltransferase family protein n=1 Tax=Alistipes sp. TaxID=1872444 RepID=UPI00405709C5